MRGRNAAPVVVAVLIMFGAVTARAAVGWHVIDTPRPGVNYNYQIRTLDSVVAFGPANVWTAGSYSASAQSRPYVLHWTGSSWHDRRSVKGYRRVLRGFGRTELGSGVGGGDVRPVARCERRRVLPRRTRQLADPETVEGR